MPPGEFTLYELLLDRKLFTPTEVELFDVDKEILELTQDCFVYPDFSGKFDPRASLTRPLSMSS